jgi:1,2-diacylglycerol 3-beta-glucosyltransferase
MDLEFAFLVLGALALVFLVHALFVAGASLLPLRRRVDPGPPTRTRRFTVLVPARNEEKLIARTLVSLRALDYDKELVRVVVIADRCTDRTAEIARDEGATCLERDEPGEGGKGQALSWAFETLLPDDRADAFVVVDADTIVDTGVLSAFSRHLDSGAEAVQGYYDVLEPERSLMASFTFAGFAVSRNLNYRGRTRLGWGANLLGNGMCFSREVIERFGWGAHSISEDLEYQLELFLDDVRVVFAPEARVCGEVPSGVRAYHSQRSRWDLGKYELRNRYVPRLLAKAIRERDPAALNAAFELIAPPYALLGGLILGPFFLYLALGPARLTANHILWGSMTAAFVAWVLAGLVAARAPARVYVNLAYAPLFVVWRVLIALASPFRKGDDWNRPER